MRRMEFDFEHGNWVYTDEFGNVWRLAPSGDPSFPLVITIEKRS